MTKIRPLDRLILQSGLRVTVYGTTTHDDGTISVHWERLAVRGEPGFRDSRDHDHGDHNDGRYLGSLIAVPPDHRWKVEAATTFVVEAAPEPPPVVPYDEFPEGY